MPHNSACQKKLSLIAPRGIVSPREERRQCLFKAREGREREKRRGSKFRKVDSAVATTTPEVGRGHRTYVQKTQRPYGLSWSCGLAGKGPLEQQQQQTPQWRKQYPPSFLLQHSEREKATRFLCSFNRWESMVASPSPSSISGRIDFPVCGGRGYFHVLYTAEWSPPLPSLFASLSPPRVIYDFYMVDPSWALRESSREEELRRE